MQKYLILFMSIVLSLGLFINHAEAKRFGGGKSFGVQRSSSNYSRTTSNSFNNPSLNQPRNGMSRWLGPLAGLVTGGLLASLFMGNGIGSGIITWLMLGLATFFIINYFRNRSRANVNQPSQFQQYHSQNNSSQLNSPSSSFSENPFYKKSWENNQSPNNYPAGFQAENFVRDAKVQFIRLQAAYDQKNLGDIRQFTAPEIFAEIQMQLNERGDTANHTEVVNLNAEIMDVTNENTNILATVRFHGLIKEDRDQPPINFHETWHFQQDPFSKNWLVVGIQQD